MVDKAEIERAVADCTASLGGSSDPKATINEYCAALAREKTWTEADVAIVQLRLRRALDEPHLAASRST